jgi:hypothetical protein
MQAGKRRRRRAQQSARGQPQQQQVKRGKRHRQPGACPVCVGAVQQRIEAEKAERGIRHRQQDQRQHVPAVNVGCVFNFHPHQPRREREDQKEAQHEEASAAELQLGVVAKPPADEDERRAGEGSEQQARPGLESYKDQHGKVEQQQVAQQGHFVVLAGGEQAAACPARRQSRRAPATPRPAPRP